MKTASRDREDRMLQWLLLLVLPFLANAVDTNHAEKLAQHIEMFTPVDDIQVLGPTIFPKPTDVIVQGQPALQPYSGKHRPDQDAVFAYASEYKLEYYVTFIESLLATGYPGDIVLSVSQINIDDPSTKKYLESVPNLVLYVPELVCYNFEGEAVESAKGGIRTCQCHHLYADANGTPLEDPRPARTIATIRYELYWLWTQHYHKDRWILLVDARDTFFQTNPFDSVPRNTDPTLQSGLLYFFGENVDATRLGKSKSNNKWLTNAYGDLVAEAMREKPTICSGATLGEQVALEAYARAMSAEYDDTRVVLMGADQGFHNFLYYSGKLRHAEAIHDIVVFDQGMGMYEVICRCAYLQSLI